MSFTLHGIAVSSGIAIGYAHLLSHRSLEVAHYVLPKQFIAEEIARFDAALLATRNEFSSLRSNRPSYAAAEFDAFLELPAKTHLFLFEHTILPRSLQFQRQD